MTTKLNASCENCARAVIKKGEKLYFCRDEKTGKFRKFPLWQIDMTRCTDWEGRKDGKEME